MAKVSQAELTERATFFETFLTRDEEYQDKLKNLLSTTKSCYRLEVNLRDLEARKAGISSALINDPSGYLPAFEIGVQRYVSGSEDFKTYTEESAAIRIAITGDFGRCHVTPRGLSQALVNKMVCVEGVVTSTTTVKARVTQSIYYCKDPHDLESWAQTRRREHRDNTNLLWQQLAIDAVKVKEDEKGNVFEEEYGLCDYKDQQKIIIQEAPENAPTGKIPCSLEAILEQDNVDKVKPGDRVRLVGVYKTFPSISNDMTSGVFPMRIIVNSIKKIQGEILKAHLQMSDTKEIKKIARRADFFELLSRSFAPSISGNPLVKKGLLLAMVGGSEKNFETGTHLRGDINVLLVGDPSCGKSQLCRFIMRMSPIAISTTGRGSSGVGLTAAVRVDQRTGERSLEAGAMVLGDGGTVIIDEFDKMSEGDRVAIHETMEQQTVTIAKAGIHVTLNARCSVVAAANPAYSSWDDNLGLHDNINLPDSLLSRFDLIFVMRDEMSKEKDRKISQQVLKQLMYQPPEETRNMRDIADVHDSVMQKDIMEDETNKKKIGTAVYEERHPSMTDADKSELLTVEFLKKYLRFCKEQREDPQLSREASEEIGVNYAQLRQRMATESTGAGMLAVTTRTLEAIIRMSSAHAKLRLAKEVTKEDVQVACELLQESRQMEVRQYDDVPQVPDEYVDDMDDNMHTKSKKDKKREKKKARNNEDEDDDDDNEGPDMKKRKKDFIETDNNDATFIRLKNELFAVFLDKKALDITMSQFTKHLNKKGITYTMDEVHKCINTLVQQEKLHVEDDTIFLTT